MRVIKAGDIYPHICKFSKGYGGPCQNPIELEGIMCEEHAGLECASCGEQATHSCAHAGQFVCGYPLCNNCIHVRFSHERKKDAPPIRKVSSGDLGL